MRYKLDTQNLREILIVKLFSRRFCNYLPDPANVDLSVFHSIEVPKGSAMNYNNGITPFVLAKVNQRNGQDAFIMETGFRERQGISSATQRLMRFEPRLILLLQKSS